MSASSLSAFQCTLSIGFAGLAPKFASRAVISVHVVLVTDRIATVQRKFGMLVTIPDIVRGGEKRKPSQSDGSNSRGCHGNRAARA
jgi:hypothetical protein